MSLGGACRLPRWRPAWRWHELGANTIRDGESHQCDQRDYERRAQVLVVRAQDDRRALG